MRILITINTVLSVVLWLVGIFGAKKLETQLNYYGSSILTLLWAIALFLVSNY